MKNLRFADVCFLFPVLLIALLLHATRFVSVKPIPIFYPLSFDAIIVLFFVIIPRLPLAKRQ